MARDVEFVEIGDGESRKVVMLSIKDAKTCLSCRETNSHQTQHA